VNIITFTYITFSSIPKSYSKNLKTIGAHTESTNALFRPSKNLLVSFYDLYFPKQDAEGARWRMTQALTVMPWLTRGHGDQTVKPQTVKPQTVKPPLQAGPDM
jgi:hypothetical protein